MTINNTTSRIENESLISSVYSHLATDLQCDKTALQYLRWYNMGSYTLIPERAFNTINSAFVDKKVTPDFIESLKNFLLKANYSAPQINQRNI